VPRLFADIPFHVNFLQADGIMANHRFHIVIQVANIHFIGRDEPKKAETDRKSPAIV
jgi:hypothetical protein